MTVRREIAEWRATSAKSGWSLLFIWSVSFVWLNQIDQTDQMNQINPRSSRQFRLSQTSATAAEPFVNNAGYQSWRSRLFTPSRRSRIKFSLPVPIRTSRLIYGDYDDASTMSPASSRRLPCEYPKRYRCRRSGLARSLTHRLQNAQRHRVECWSLSHNADCCCAGTNPPGRGSLSGSLVQGRALRSGVSSVQPGRP